MKIIIFAREVKEQSNVDALRLITVQPRVVKTSFTGQEWKPKGPADLITLTKESNCPKMSLILQKMEEINMIGHKERAENSGGGVQKKITIDLSFF